MTKLRKQKNEKITKEQIFTSVQEILIAGNIPTLTKIRGYLGTGSKTTINKYFKLWKQECFKKAINEHESFEINVNFIEEKRILEQALNKQISQNEHYASELINAEKALIKLNEENQQLQTSKQQLQLELKEAIAIKIALEKLHKELQAKLDHNNNQTISQQQHIINDLRIELKILNETSLSALRETSTKSHEALMQEKVTNINLQTKIDSLTKEFTETKKQLELVELKTKIQVQALQRQVKEQQQVLRQYVAPEEFSQLEQGLESSVLLAGDYGK